MYKIWEYLTGYFHNFKCLTSHFYKLSDVSWLQSSQPLQNTALKMKHSSNSSIAFPSLFSGYEHFWIIMFHSKSVVSSHDQFFYLFLRPVPNYFCSSAPLSWRTSLTQVTITNLRCHYLCQYQVLKFLQESPGLRNQKIVTEVLRAHLSSSVVTRNVKIFTVKSLTK